MVGYAALHVCHVYIMVASMKTWNMVISADIAIFQVPWMHLHQTSKNNLLIASLKMRISLPCYQPHGWWNAYYQKLYIEGLATHHMSHRDSQFSVCHSEDRVFSSLFSSKTCATCCSFLKGYKCSVYLLHFLPKNVDFPEHHFLWNSFLWISGLFFLRIVI